MSKQLLRQSFDRFDDNLVENILSYLTFTQKVLFESISKQWKRSIYNKQTKLHIMPNPRWDLTDLHLLDRIFEPLVVIDYNTGTASSEGLQAINKFWLKSILKKCKSVEEVIFECFVDLEVLDIICKLCPKLKNLEFETIGLNSDDLAHFGLRYGHKFERIGFNTWYFYSKYWNNLLINCNHLKSLTTCINTLFSEEPQYLPRLQAVNVYQLHQDYHANNGNLHNFDLFCQTHIKTMTKLSILAYNEMNVIETDSFIKSISKLTNLKNLNFSLQNMSAYSDSFYQNLNILSKGCPQLEKLKLWLYDTALKSEDFFYGFEGFNNLIDLEIIIKNINSEKIQKFKGSVKCLKSSKNLKYLNIFVNSVGEEFFEDIGKHLPNLSTLIMNCEFEITDKTIFQLSHLKKLKKFVFINKFDGFHQSITDESICAVLNSCPALENIDFSSRPNITNKTIETLIGCANSRPKRRIHFEIRSSVVNNQNLFETIDLNTFIDKIPQNLTIVIN